MRTIFFAEFLPDMGQYISLIMDNKPWSPTCSPFLCSSLKIKVVRWWFESSILGCRLLYANSELPKRPPIHHHQEMDGGCIICHFLVIRDSWIVLVSPWKGLPWAILTRHTLALFNSSVVRVPLVVSMLFAEGTLLMNLRHHAITHTNRFRLENSLMINEVDYGATLGRA